MSLKYATSEDQQRAAKLLFEAMGEAIDNCTLPEAVVLLVSQRENARNAAAAYKAEAEELANTLARLVAQVEDRIIDAPDWDAAPLAADCAHARAILAKGGQ